MTKLLEKWYTWVALIVGLLTIVTLVADLPGKIKGAFGTKPSLTLSGVILDEESEPLRGVDVRLPELDLTDTTNQDGEFKFREIKAGKKTSAKLIARKTGYHTHNTDVALGRTDISFTMRPKEKPPNGPPPENGPLLQTLAGVIWDGATDEPLAGVDVTLPEFDRTTTTKQNGKYKFQVEAPKQHTVNLIARKTGYGTQDRYATLGDTGFNFTMEPKK